MQKLFRQVKYRTWIIGSSIFSPWLSSHEFCLEITQPLSLIKNLMVRRLVNLLISVISQKSVISMFNCLSPIHTLVVSQLVTEATPLSETAGFVQVMEFK